MHRGFILPLTLSILAIVGILGTTMFMVSRQQLTSTRFYTDRERAYQIGSGAIEIGLEVTDEFLELLSDFNRVTDPEAITDELKPFANTFLNQGQLKEEAEFDLSDEPLLTKLIAEEAWQVNLTVKMKKMRSFSKTSGVPQDPREAIYHFFVTAVVRGEDLLSSDLTVTAFKRWQLVNILLPVLGKFVFFTRNIESVDVNVLEDALTFNNQASPVILEAGQVLNRDEVLSVVDLKKFISKQGWVFLGGNSELVMNMSHGWDKHEFQDAYTATAVDEYALRPEDSHLADFGSEMGLEFSWTRYVSGLYKELSSPVEQEVLPEMDVDGSSIFNLYGSAERPSPTLVLGNVVRKSAMRQGLWIGSKQKSCVLPYLEEFQFHTNTWPGGLVIKVIELMRKNFNDNYFEYKKQMSQVIKQPYNDGLLWAMEVDDQENQPAFIRECTNLDADLLDQMRIDLISVDSGTGPFLCEGIAGTRFTLQNDSDRVIFENINLNNLNRLAHLEERSHRKYDTYDAFLKRYEKEGVLKLGGVITIKGNVKINKSLRVGSLGGGVILVEGDIHVDAGIETDSEEPFSLVSLQGDIRINTSAPVHASLVCLGGTLFFPTAPKFTLVGSVAANRIDVGANPVTSLTIGERKIMYNSSIDPTISSNWKASYRVMQDRGWVYTIE